MMWVLMSPYYTPPSLLHTPCLVYSTFPCRASSTCGIHLGSNYHPGIKMNKDWNKDWDSIQAISRGPGFLGGSRGVQDRRVYTQFVFNIFSHCIPHSLSATLLSSFLYLDTSFFHFLNLKRTGSWADCWHIVC